MNKNGLKKGILLGLVIFAMTASGLLLIYFLNSSSRAVVVSIHGQSMLPQYQSGQQVTLQEHQPGKPINRGSVVLFSVPPHLHAKKLIKWVVAIPGDRVLKIQDQPQSDLFSLQINGQVLMIPGSADKYRFGPQSSPLFIQTLELIEKSDHMMPPQKYLVLGNNQSDNIDSRRFGWIDESQIQAVSDSSQEPMH